MNWIEVNSSRILGVTSTLFIKYTIWIYLLLRLFFKNNTITSNGKSKSSVYIPKNIGRVCLKILKEILGNSRLELIVTGSNKDLNVLTINTMISVTSGLVTIGNIR